MFNLKTLLWNSIFYLPWKPDYLLEETDPEQTKSNNIFASDYLPWKPDVTAQVQNMNHFYNSRIDFT